MALIKNNNLLLFLIAAIAALIFIPFIGNCHLFDWDEVNFAECAREMVVSGNYSRVQLNYQPFWEKPPFFIWLQAISMNIFGVNEFAARFPNAICSIVSLLVLFEVGRKYHSAKFGIVWVLLYASTLLPHVYFKSGIIDPWFNLFIFLCIYQCIQFLHPSQNKKRIGSPLLAGLFLGLAVLTKGPAALLIVALCLIVFLIWNKQIKSLWTMSFIVFASTTLFVSASWFIIELIKGNEKVIEEFIDYQIRLFKTEDSGHRGSYFYHFLVLLIGCFPTSFIFILSYFKTRELDEKQQIYRKMALSLFWVVLVLFSIIKTKIIHYSSLCYFPLTFIAAIGLVQDQKMIRFNFFSGFMYHLISVLISSAVVVVTFIDLIKPILFENNLIKDEFAIANLKANVNWSGFEFLIGIVFQVGCLLIYCSIRKQKISLFYLGTTFNLLFLSFSIASIAPKIEGYTQNAAISFYKNVAYQDCYIETRGFKSYAYLFYGQVQPEDFSNPDQIKEINQMLDRMEKDGHSRLKSYASANLNWLEHGKIDKMAYVVSKTIDEKEVLRNKNLTKLYDLNGYSFFARMPDKPAN